MANSATDDAATFAGGTTCLAADSNFRSVIADNEDLSSLADIFSRHGFPIRIAGGAVRDLLAGQTPKDLGSVQESRLSSQFAFQSCSLPQLLNTQ